MFKTRKSLSGCLSWLILIMGGLALSNAYAGAPAGVVSNSKETATLKISVFYYNEDAPDFRGEPVGSGIEIKINGEVRAVTDVHGAVTLEAPGGEVEVAAVIPSVAEGKETVTLTAGETSEVKLLLANAEPEAGYADLILDELNEGILPWDFSSFTLRFVDNGTTAVLNQITDMRLIDENGSASATIKDLFSIDKNGLIVVSNLDAFRKQLLQNGLPANIIEVEAVASSGVTYSNIIRFYLGRYQLAAQLAAPPSNPKLDIANIPVTITLSGTDLMIDRVSDASGYINVGIFPGGEIEIYCEAVYDDNYYYGSGNLFLQSNCKVKVNMCHISDIQNGIPLIEETSLYAK